MKRTPPAAGRGRPLGALNKHTGAVKEMILAALDKVGGADYLAEQAVKQPVAFMTLVGKVLPMQVVGRDGGNVTLEIITGVERSPGE